MDYAIARDDDAFVIVKMQGQWFGSVWYKNFDERCNMYGQIWLNHFNKNNPGWSDIYVRKSSIACEASTIDAAICCANSADDVNDPFIQSCATESYEQTTYQYFDDVCDKETRTITKYGNQYDTQTFSEGIVERVDNSVCCNAYKRDGDTNNENGLLYACPTETSRENGGYEIRDDGKCYMTQFNKNYVDLNSNMEFD